MQEAGKRRIRVLAVDDDPDMTRLIARLLENRGLEVQQSQRGLHALSLIKASPPDLVILDAMLPEVHGFDIVKKLKESDRYRHIPIIIISSVYHGWRIADDLEQALGVDAFIEKPFKLSTLWGEVERLLTGKGGRPRRSGHKMATSAHASHEEGLARFRSGDIDGALERIEDAVRIDPYCAYLHLEHGVMLLKKKGKAYEAMRAFERTLDLDPKQFTALRSLAVLYEEHGFKNKAVEMWERAMRCSPDAETAAQMRARLLSLL